MKRLVLLIGMLLALFVLSSCGLARAPAVTATYTSATSLTVAPAPTSAPVQVQPTLVSVTTVIPITPGAPVPKGTATPAPNPASIVQGTLQGLTNGKMLFNPPKEMDQGAKARIELRITRNPDEELGTGLQGKGTPQTSSVKVSSSMSARLTGDDFEIEPLNTEEQVIAGDTFTQWAWDVTPLGMGMHTLHLRVTARVSVDGTQGQKDLPVVERDVNIRVNPLYLIGSFFGHYWEWVVTAIFVPLVGIGWKIRADRRAKKA